MFHGGKGVVLVYAVIMTKDMWEDANIYRTPVLNYILLSNTGNRWYATTRVRDFQKQHTNRNQEKLPIQTMLL